MRKAFLTIGATVLALSLMAPIAAAQGRFGCGYGPGRAGDDERGRSCVFDDLDLSEDQQAAVDALQAEHWDRVAELRDEMMAAHEALMALADDESATAEEVAAAEAQLDDARDAMRAERTAFRTQVYDLLTPEQQAQVGNAWRLGLDRGRGRHGRGFGPGHHRGHGGWGPHHGYGQGACNGPCGATE